MEIVYVLLLLLFVCGMHKRAIVVNLAYHSTIVELSLAIYSDIGIVWTFCFFLIHFFFTVERVEWEAWITKNGFRSIAFKWPWKCQSPETLPNSMQNFCCAHFAQKSKNQTSHRTHVRHSMQKYLEPTVCVSQRSRITCVILVTTHTLCLLCSMLANSGGQRTNKRSQSVDALSMHWQNIQFHVLNFSFYFRC